MSIFEQKSTEDQKKLKDAINEIVDQMVIKSGADELIKEICDQVNDKYDVKGGDLKARASQLYKARYEQEKFAAAREKIESTYDDVDFMEGISQ